jgi:hypothetical protein
MSRLIICLLMAALSFVVACGGKDENNASQNPPQTSAGPKPEASQTNAQGRSLAEEMARLKVSTALLIPSSRIVHLPVWSPDSDQIASMVGNRWYRVNLKQVALNEFDWKTQKAGQVSIKESVALAPGVEIDRWQKAQATLQENRLAVSTKNGLKLELRKEGAKTSFIATKIGQNPRVIWSVEEKCEGLTLSPDEKYVAFVGETSGILVVNLDDL